MAQKMEEWLDTAVKKYKKYPIDTMSNFYFMRDPERPQITDDSNFFSPCDGIIIYQEEVRNYEEPVLEVKGEKYSLKDITQRVDLSQPSLVIGNFMTFFHPHIQRSPYGGFLSYKFLDPISTRNLPMLWVEKGIVEKHKFDAYGGFEYLKKNERLFCEFYSPHLKYRYYLVIIADFDVQSIMLFDYATNAIIEQNARFCFIRWGSQVDTILPLDDRLRFEFVNEVTDSVEAGIDPIVRVTRRKGFLRGR